MAKDTKYGKVKISGIPDDEPVFILRAQDKLALPIIARYAIKAEEVRVDADRTEFFENLATTQSLFADFAEENPDRMKVPD